jgi:hypothetical protein
MRILARLLCVAAVAIVGIVVFVASADADLIAHEPFNYQSIDAGRGRGPSGEGIGGLNGGIGFAGPWEDRATMIPWSGATVAGNLGTGIVTGAAGEFPEGERTDLFSYTDSQGHQLIIAGGQARTSFGSKSVATRLLDGTYGNDGETIWLSFLGQTHIDKINRSAYSGIALGDGAGYFGRRSGPGNQNWGYRDGLTDMHSSDVSTGELAFFVARIDYQAGNDEVSIWLDPDLDSEPLLANAAITASVPMPAFSHIALLGNTSSDYDEIRLGTDYASVAARVPEPASVALALSGLVGLLLWRRKR